MSLQASLAARSRHSLLALLVIAVIAACSSSGGGGGGPSLTSIEVTPAVPSLAAGTSTQLVATGIYSDSTTQDLTEDVTWTSADPLVATVDDMLGTRGITLASALGTSLITATLDSVSGETTLTVTAAVLVSLEVTPADPSIALGTTEAFVATGIFSDGTKQDLSTTVAWDSSDPLVATSAVDGVASSLATGTTTITAMQAAISSSSDLTVTPAVLVTVEVSPTNPDIALGTAQPFVATGIFSDSTNQDLTDSAVWTSDATGVATVDSAPGTGGAAASVSTGIATITADVGGTSGASVLTVTAAALVSIGVTPANPSVPLGLSEQLVATGLYTDATTQDLTDQVTWSSSDPLSVQVSNAAGTRGLAVSLLSGTATVAALLDGVTGSTDVTITAATLVSLSVSPESSSIPLGTQQNLVATGIYTDGSTQDLTAESVWSSSDPGITTISNAGGSEGLATSAGVGLSTVTATYLGVSGFTSLTVAAATLVSLDVTPSSPDVPLGFTQQFTATGTYTDATTQDLTASVTWASSDPAVATVGNAAGSEGFGTSVAAGSSSVSATIGAVSGSTQLVISAAVLTSIDVSVDSTTVPLGFTESLVATGFYSDGSASDLTGTVAWDSMDPAVATVSNAAGSEGLLSSAGVGVTTVTATFGAISGMTDMTVTSAVLTSIAVTPDLPTIAVLGGQQFTATGTYSDGSTQDLTATATWDSSVTVVATISNAARSEGLVTGLITGMSSITASVGGTSGGTTLTVSGATLTSIAIDPTSPSAIALGTLAQFTVTGTYSDLSTQDLTTSVTWSSADPAVATISNAALTEGVATSVAVGMTTISADFGGFSDSAPLDVVALTLASIAVTPADASIATRSTLQYTATGTFTDMSMQDITISVAWKSSKNPTASISGKGIAKSHNKTGVVDPFRPAW